MGKRGVEKSGMVAPGIEIRGKAYFMRFRVPVRFHVVEPLREINRTLGTDSLSEAKARYATERRALERRWEALLLSGAGPGSQEAYEGAKKLLDDANLPYRRIDQLLTDPLNDILVRLERLANQPANSPLIPALLGGVDLPRTLVSEMPEHHERIRADYVSVKNARQMRDWRNKYRRAAAAFVKVVGDKPVAEITAQDARAYRSYWSDKRKTDSLTTAYVNKQLVYMKQLVNSFYSDHGLLEADYSNHFVNISLEELGPETRQEEGRKLALPVVWIRDTLLDTQKIAGLNAQARDITIICAETGAREAEIFDLPEEDIHLDHPIPHICLEMVESGEHKRQLKNMASKRQIVLLGHALDAMRRNPRGFPKYRGKASYYATVNNFLARNKFFRRCPRDRHATTRSVDFVILMRTV